MKKSEIKNALKEVVRKIELFKDAYEMRAEVLYTVNPYAVEEMGFDTYVEVKIYRDEEIMDDYELEAILDEKGSKAKTHVLAKDVVKYLKGFNIEAKFDKVVYQ